MRKRDGLVVDLGSQRSPKKEAPWIPRRCYLGLLFAMFLTVPAWPQQKSGDLTTVSIEDLMNMEVNSVSKTEQKVSRTAAAIYVVTQKDIRRSGATNIPDVLRMVPGVDVAH